MPRTERSDEELIRDDFKIAFPGRDAPKYATQQEYVNAAALQRDATDRLARFAPRLLGRALAAEARIAAVENEMHVYDDEPINPQGAHSPGYIDGWDAAMGECWVRLRRALGPVGDTQEAK